MQRAARLLRWPLIAALLGIGVVTTQASAADSCGRGATFDRLSPTWLALHPSFSSGPAAVSLLATVPFRPDQMYASNGFQVMRTDDGGCSWSVVLDTSSLLGLLPSPIPGTITAISAPSSATSTKRLYVAARVATADSLTGRSPFGRPVVYVSSDQGKPGTWSSSESDVDGTPRAPTLPPVGRVTALVACDYVGDTAYAIVDPAEDGASTTAALYETTDGGISWQRRTALQDHVQWERLLVNSTVPQRVYVIGGGKLWRSADSGQVFAPMGPAGADVADASVAVGKGYVRIVESRRSAGLVDRTINGGVDWTTYSTPLAGAAISAQPLQETVALRTDTRLVLAAPGSAVEVKPPGAVMPHQIALSATSTSGYSMTGLRDGAVLKAVVRAGKTPKLTPLLRPVRLLPVDQPEGTFPTVLLPPSQSLVVAAGSYVDVPYTLLVPRTPSPLDVLFLVDTTGSMQTTIDGLRADLANIVNELQVLGLDVQFGLGEYKDVPSPFGGGDSSDFAYLLRRQIGPADKTLEAALNALKAGGGSDAPESDLTALMYSTTGAKQIATDGKTVLVPEGLNAGYRPGALRLAVNATDERFHEGANYPTWGATVREMLRRNVHQVGLAAGENGVEDLQRMAGDTDAIAPEAGLDCDGDGRIDLQAGDPLVCFTSGSATSVGGVSTGGVHLASAVVALAESLADRRPLHLRVHGARSNFSVTDQSLRTVNLKADNEVAATVRFSCPLTMPPGQHEGRLTASAGGLSLTSAEMSVTCLPPGVKPKPQDPYLHSEFLAVPPAIAAAPQPPPQQPVPNPNPNLNPQPNPGANANAGLVEQEEQMPMLALAGADPASLDTGQEELAMSTRRVTTDPPWEYAAAVGLLMCAAAGAVHRSRVQAGLRVRGAGVWS